MESATSRRHTRAIVAVVLAIAISVAFAVATQPLVAEFVGRGEVQRAHESLRLPAGWSELDPPVIQIPQRGFVLLSAVYKRPGDGAANLADFVDLEKTQGWRLVGGAPDLSTVVLQMNDMSLGASVLQGAGVVRVELSRFTTWW